MKINLLLLFLFLNVTLYQLNRGLQCSDLSKIQFRCLSPCEYVLTLNDYNIIITVEVRHNDHRHNIVSVCRQPKPEDKQYSLTAAKDRAQLTATTAMSVVHVALLKSVIEGGPAANRYVPFTSLAAKEQCS